MSVEATASANDYGRGNPPPPLVNKPLKHPIRWTRNTTLLFITGAVITYFCVLIVVAIYYDVFETTDVMTTWWHSFIPNDTIRHAVRDVGEGLLGGLGGVYAVRNRYKKLKAPGKLDRLEMRLGIPNVHDDKRLSFVWLLALPLLVVVYAQVGFWLAFGLEEAIMHFGHLHSLEWAPQPNAPLFSLHSKLVTGLLSDWPKKLVGYAAAFFMGRRPAKAVFDDLQLWLCEQRVLRDQHLGSWNGFVGQRVLNAVRRRANPAGDAYETPVWNKPGLLDRVLGRIQQRDASSPAPWYYPPTWKATFNDVKASQQINGALHGRLPVFIIRVIMFVSAFLVIQGWYVMTFIAK